MTSAVSANGTCGTIASDETSIIADAPLPPRLPAFRIAPRTAPRAAATGIHALTLPADAAGQRFDVALARALPQFSRARLRAWIDAGRVTEDGRVAVADAQGPRRRTGRRSRRIAAERNGVRCPKRSRFRSSPRTRRCSSSTSRRGSSCIRAPATGTGTLLNALLHHAPQLAAGAARRHRPSARQGHERPPGRRQDARRAHRARARAAGAHRDPRISRAGHGRHRARRAPSTRRSAGIRRVARRWRSSPRGRRRARISKCSSASGSRRCCAAGSRRAARTRSAFISPRSVIRSSAIPRTAGRARSRFRDRRCTRRASRSSIRSRAARAAWESPLPRGFPGARRQPARDRSRR